MKTIEYFSTELADKLCSSSDDKAKFISFTEINEYIKIGIKSGVEFAQRWIPIEEEKPGLWEYVLCKSSVNDHYIGCFFNEKINIDTPNVTITHWRPIELI